ncbi:PREDICTED: SH3 domain-containing RING finger protein 3 [Condylura cristata]|uniref:SH3 domain-containing RING finger protein 3 n=1 Tax=Condylura cristata TaxID=143302 RepID=UPI0006439D4A|nr:PREDICTED: SH3 domain-containing RING finger protein 3 [Condylura cristata]
MLPTLNGMGAARCGEANFSLLNAMLWSSSGLQAALYSYEGKEPGDLKFSKGDVIILRRRVDDHWFHGELHGVHGFLPASYVQCMRPLPQAPPQGKALYDFEMKDRDQDKDCLTFTKDEILTVIRRVDDNWAEGMLGDKIGIFPLLYVEDSSSSAGPATAAEQQSTTAPKVQLPLNVYLALYAYKPQKNDELELRKGEMYRVLEKCQDGWFKGMSLRTGLSGVFPGNYVTPVSRVPVGVVGSPRNNGGSPLAKGMATTSHPGGGSLSSPATATRSTLPLTAFQAQAQAQAQHQAASSPVSTCLLHSPQLVTSQVRSTISTAAHTSTQAQDRPTATVSPLRTQNSPSRLPTASLRPYSVVSPQHVHQPLMQTVVGAQCPRPTIPLTSAASAITPPNVSAANLNGEVGGGPISSLLTSSPTNTGCRPEEKKNEKGMGLHHFWVYCPSPHEAPSSTARVTRQQTPAHLGLKPLVPTTQPTRLPPRTAVSSSLQAVHLCSCYSGDHPQGCAPYGLVSMWSLMFGPGFSLCVVAVLWPVWLPSGLASRV